MGKGDDIESNGIGTTDHGDGNHSLRSRPAQLTIPRDGLLSVTASCLSARLATTPKLTGGHDVARGPDQVVGFALRPGRISQLLLAIRDVVPMLRLEC